MRGCCVLVGSVLAAVGTGCAQVQSSEICPGSSCGSGLRGVYDAVGDVTRVADVEQVRRDAGLEKGEIGSIEVTAAVKGADQARELAVDLIGVYQRGKIGAVDQIHVTISPTAGSTIASVLRQTDYARPAQALDCAATRCRAEAARFRRAWSDAPIAADLDLRRVSWATDDQGRPIFTLSLLAHRPMTPRRASDLANSSDAFAATAGLSKSAAVRTVVSYPRIVEYGYSYDVARKQLQMLES